MSPCFPSGQLFEVHGSKFKPHPVGNVGLTSVMGITHAMPLLGISKDPLMRIAPGILGCTWCRQPDLPDVPQDSLHAVFGAGT